MGEIPGPKDDKEYDAPNSRRSFIKDAALVAGGALFGSLAGGEIEDGIYKEEILEEQTGRIALYSERREEQIPGTTGPDFFYSRSGWDEYNVDTYSEALRVVNSQTHPDVDLDHPQKGDTITVLYKIDKKE